MSGRADATFAGETLAPEEARELLERTGAVLHGHFLLSSGRHSDVYVQKARILERPAETMAVARTIASWYGGIDAVVAPAVGAIPLGFAVALASGARSLFAERQEGEMTLRRGFELGPGERTLVVEDVVTTGASAREVWAAVRGLGGEAVGVAALIDRTDAEPGFPLRAVVRIDAGTWSTEECPMCAAGGEPEAPGSRHLR